MAQISDKQAFLAMFLFLEAYWERNGKPGELGSLLGSMMALQDGMPADSAMWTEWLVALERAVATE